MTELSRRQVLAGSGFAAIALAVPLPFSIAQGIPPATVAKIASAGFELYKMSRSGGGGIGNLLAAQTEMLRAINDQLQTISETLLEVYAGINEIRDMLGVMPEAVASATFRGNAKNAIGWGGEILKTIEARAKIVGRQEAKEAYKDELTSALYQLRPAMETVGREPSVANAPLLCLAWYAELQMMMMLPRFDKLRLQQRASFYAGALDRWVSAIEGEIAATGAAAAQITTAVNAAAPFNGHSCSTDLWNRVNERSCGGGGKHGSNSRTCAWGEVDQTVNTLAQTNEEVDADLHEFLQQAAYFEEVGLPIAREIKVLAIPSWSHESRRVDWNGTEGLDRVPGYDEQLAAYRNRECRGAVASPARFVTGLNELKNQARKLRLKAVVHYHFLLASKDARRSITAVVERLQQI